MKVAIHNGWLVFDNERPGEHHDASKTIRGRIRLTSISSYARETTAYGGIREPVMKTVTRVWSTPGEHAWAIDGDHQALLDSYFGGEGVR